MKDLNWLKSSINRLERESSQVFPHEVMVEKSDVMKLIEQVEQSELPVIPEFVAEWIIDKKKTNENLLQLGYDFFHNSVECKISHWVYENIDLFYRAWLDDFTVEEKKYYVLDNNKRTLLGKNMSGAVIEGDRVGVSELMGSEIQEHQLTEQEIREYDERYFAFTIPVEELEQ